MKKYPFSKKAVQAMLAATIAFSPVVTTGGLFAENRVEAAGTAINVDQEINQLAERFFKFYKNASFSAPTTTINNLNVDTIASQGIDLSGMTDSEKTAFTELIKGTAGLIYTNYDDAADLSAAVKSFRSANATNFNTLFDQDGAVVAEQLISFVKDLEGNLEAAIMSVALSPSPSYSKVISKAVTMTLGEGNYGNLQGKLSNVGLSVEKLFLLQESLNNNVIDPEQDIRSQMLQSAFIEKGAEIRNDGNEYSLFVPLQGTPGVSLTTSITWETSNPRVASFNGNVLKKNSNGKVTVFAKIDGMTIMSKEITVSGVGGGGGGGGDTTPTPPVDPPAPGEVTVPEGTTTTVTKGNTVVTEIPASKVSAVVGLITSEKPVVPLTLAKPAAGQKAQAQVPASLFTEAAEKNSNAAVNIKTEEASYKLPASEINASELAAALGVAEGDVQIIIAVNVVAPTAAEVAEFAKNNTLVSSIIEFEVKAVSGNKEVSITTYRNYVERVIKLNAEVSTSSVNASAGAKLNADHLAGVRINEDGSFSPVPTVFKGDEATIKSLTDSKYAIVENSKTFTDVDNGANYFEVYIEKLASKYIINGKTDSTYAPSADITRGEFAALISRSLGLVAKNPKEVKFPDVPATKAVNKNGEINAAVEAGIIKGFEDGNFKPDQPMTRAEAAIMIDRAMTFTKVADSKLDKTKKITGLADHDSISNTSRSSIEKVYQAGIMSGFNNGEFGPYKNTQRDQMAKVLDKFLQVSDMIN